jgi:LPS O-antigen subunit length determinant protein (WzzB/FepE family)
MFLSMGRRARNADDTALSPEDADRAEKTLDEYIEFVNSIENNRVRRKVEAQLGRKAVQLRQVLSIDGFSIKAMPVATDHIVTSLKATTDSKHPNENTV